MLSRGKVAFSTLAGSNQLKNKQKKTPIPENDMYVQAVNVQPFGSHQRQS